MFIITSPGEIPKYFQLSGIKAGLKSSNKKDLGLIYTTHLGSLGAVYTKNKFASAHVHYCRQKTPSHHFRCLIVNSGNANVGSALSGIQANEDMAKSIANELHIETYQTFTSSTGIIGVSLPIQKIQTAIPQLVKALNRSPESFAEAILTTDTKTKHAWSKIVFQNQEYQVYGIAKGSGMIYPKMGTMLAYILTDAPIYKNDIQTMTENVVEKSFNRITVDGDTSTNDSFYLITSNPIEKRLKTFEKILLPTIEAVAISLAKQIVADGEGAHHLIETKVYHSPSQEIANECISAVLNSSLVKTAIHGNDPNWGRILMAVGNVLSQNDMIEHISIKIQKIPVFVCGNNVNFNIEMLRQKMNEFEILLEIDLHHGNYHSTGWGCDLSRDYISINADYTT